ncbi:MAG: hypothetical protein ACTJGR_02730 [Pauljensenia sp.]
MIASGRARPPYTVRQGEQLGRAGRVFLTESEGALWVGGTAQVAIEGTIEV